jgi:hypothetical protein
VQQTQVVSRHHSPSPPPSVTTIPSFIPSTGSAESDAQKEQMLKDRFRKFWMTSIADGFKDDLEEIRKVSREDGIRFHIYSYSMVLFSGTQSGFFSSIYVD